MKGNDMEEKDRCRICNGYGYEGENICSWCEGAGYDPEPETKLED